MNIVEPHPKFSGVYYVKQVNTTKLATKNLTPGKSVYGERLVNFKSEEFRIWSPYRSKLSAAILSGLNKLPVVPGSTVLYLGAASGTTVSHISDIVLDRGMIYAVEFAPHVSRSLVVLARSRKNIAPIVADARKPDMYSHFVNTVDVLYQDIAQPFQSEIVVKNAEFYAKNNSYILLAIKARSIDVTKDPKSIYKNEIKYLIDHGIEILEQINLDPLEKDHIMILAKYK